MAGRMREVVGTLRWTAIVGVGVIVIVAGFLSGAGNSRRLERSPQPGETRAALVEAMTSGDPDSILDAALEHQAATTVSWLRARGSDHSLIANAIAAAEAQRAARETVPAAVQDEARNRQDQAMASGRSQEAERGLGGRAAEEAGR